MIPLRERNGTTWNNLGVAFDNSSLVAKSVDAYREAEQVGETLAMSNLALKLMSVGFLAEAQKQCDDAMVITDYHKNVGRTLSRLKGLEEEEDKKEIELLENARPKSDFYKRFGRAATRAERRC